MSKVGVKIAAILRGIRQAGGSRATSPHAMGCPPASSHATSRNDASLSDAGLTDRQRRYLEALPEGPFSTGETKALASDCGASPRSAQRWLKTWVREGLLTKRKRGTWEKTPTQPSGPAGAPAGAKALWRKTGALPGTGRETH